MKSPYVISGVLAMSMLVSAASATTATSLSSFGGLEESAQRYFPGSNTFQSDSFANCTTPSSGVFQMTLRYNSSGTMWWDGDRTTGNTDRQREEVKTLGAHQLIHQTFDYTTTWKMNPGFKASGSFCHITQLKSTNGVEGSSGAPMVVTSLNSGSSSAVVRYASTEFSPANVFTTHTVRNITYSPGTFIAEKIRVRTTADGEHNGQILVSLNGDSLQGLNNIEVSRPQSTEYYPKWGLYRGASTSSGFGAADYVQHSNVTAGPVSATPTASAPSFSPGGGTYSSAQTVTITTSTSGATIRYTTNGSTPTSSSGTIYSGPVTISSTTTLKAIAYASGYNDSSVTSATYTISTGGGGTVVIQAEGLSYTTSGTPTITTQADSAASGGVVAYVNSNATGQWAEFTTPSIAAGTYQVKFRYKKNNARGQHTLKIDGTQVGGTIDEYSSTSGYTEVTLGNITLATGTHAIRLTVTGKNASSSSYVLAPDCFTFVGQ